MRYSIAIPQFDYDTFDAAGLRSFLARAEELGFEGGWALEQIAGEAPLLAPLELLAWCAAGTERLRLGVAVLVTSLHDGINLVANEYVAARDNDDGVLILSRFTGASHELRDALMVNPYDVVNRDCMPSGHTMMSVLGILLAWRYRSRWRWFITIGGISVVISTIYLRYHYMVDLMAGLTLAFVVYWLHPLLVRLWQKLGIQV